MGKHADKKREEMREPAIQVEAPTFWQALAEPSKLVEHYRYKKQLIADAKEKLRIAQHKEKDGNCSQQEIDAAYDAAEEATKKAERYVG